MAKRKHGAKSAAIREYFADNPGAKPRVVVEALRQKGIRVSAQMVSVIKGKQKRGLRGRRSTSNGPLNAASLIQAKALADRMGGIAKAQEALAVLAKLI
jgi:hypothetical protein